MMLTKSIFASCLLLPLLGQCANVIGQSFLSKRSSGMQGLAETGDDHGSHVGTDGPAVIDVTLNSQLQIGQGKEHSALQLKSSLADGPSLAEGGKQGGNSGGGVIDVPLNSELQVKTREHNSAHAL
eukprot:TRINITY_DN4096_c0_g1_i1.p1 TRINITY_DN4096_c0_g1~~TRINITY_DN4096_c0_g1_i1.p1  ORF type:complete len:126 (-),score=31.02 TRINITY_DN4096_c0_g1_i1:168-545(-)